MSSIFPLSRLVISLLAGLKSQDTRTSRRQPGSGRSGKMAGLMVDRAAGSGEGRSAAPTLRGGGGSCTSPVARKHPGEFHRGARAAGARREP